MINRKKKKQRQILDSKTRQNHGKTDVHSKARKFKNVNPKKMKETKFESTSLGVKLFTAGSAACLADLVTFPLDTAKVRLQIQGESMSKNHTQGTRYKNVLHTITTIAKEEGAKSLYNGLSAGLQRQMCFASIRIGLYDTVKSFYQGLIGGDQNKPYILTRICAGMTTGGLAVIVAQPTDVVKIRSQASRGKEVMYRSTLEAYRGIYKKDGLPGLWQGTYPNIARNCIVNVSEIVCYDIVKETILNSKLLDDNIVCHFTSGLLAGFFTTVVASPVDVIKTRYMNSPAGKYKSALHCTVLTFKNEGLTAFYKGFVPSFSRLVTWNIAMWVSYEKLKSIVAQILS